MGGLEKRERETKSENREHFVNEANDFGVDGPYAENDSEKFVDNLVQLAEIQNKTDLEVWGAYANTEIPSNGDA